jgi:hypothetical protein
MLPTTSADRLDAPDLDVADDLLGRRRREQGVARRQGGAERRKVDVERRAALPELAEEIADGPVAAPCELVEGRVQHRQGGVQVSGRFGGLELLEELDDRAVVARGRDDHGLRGARRRNQAHRVTGRQRVDHRDRLADRPLEGRRRRAVIRRDLEPGGQPVVHHEHDRAEPAGVEDPRLLEDGTRQRRPKYEEDRAARRQQQDLLEPDPLAVLAEGLDQETHRRPLDGTPPPARQQMDDDRDRHGDGTGDEQADRREGHGSDSRGIGGVALFIPPSAP